MQSLAKPPTSFPEFLEWTPWNLFLIALVCLVVVVIVWMRGAAQPRRPRSRILDTMGFDDEHLRLYEGEETATPQLSTFPNDQRKAHRRVGTVTPVLLSDLRLWLAPHPAVVLDRSTGGLRITCDTDVPLNRTLEVRAENAPPDSPWVPIKVCNSRKVGKNFELGCRFVQTPPWNILLLFG